MSYVLQPQTTFDRFLFFLLFFACYFERVIWSKEMGIDWVVNNVKKKRWHSKTNQEKNKKKNGTIVVQKNEQKRISQLTCMIESSMIGSAGTIGETTGVVGFEPVVDAAAELLKNLNPCRFTGGNPATPPPSPTLLASGSGIVVVGETGFW
jgi:hypothetical protein